MGASAFLWLRERRVPPAVPCCLLALGVMLSMDIVPDPITYTFGTACLGAGGIVAPVVSRLTQGVSIPAVYGFGRRLLFGVSLAATVLRDEQQTSLAVPAGSGRDIGGLGFLQSGRATRPKLAERERSSLAARLLERGPCRAGLVAHIHGAVLAAPAIADRIFAALTKIKPPIAKVVGLSRSPCADPFPEDSCFAWG
jgi:hypothetical protein